MDQPTIGFNHLKIHSNTQQPSQNPFPTSNSTVLEPVESQKPFLRRASISDTHLPRLDIPHFVTPQETSPFTRVLSGLIESGSNLSLNKLNSTSDHQHFQHNHHLAHQQKPQLSSSWDRKSSVELGGFDNTPAVATKNNLPLRKSSSVANYVLSGHLSPTSHSHSTILGSGQSTHQIHTIPEQETSDQGLTMNMSATRSVTTGGLATANAALSSPQLGSTPPDRKSATAFGGLATMMSGLFNKPSTHLGDREENYRYIMALDR